jgi:hypothetical protein
VGEDPLDELGEAPRDLAAVVEELGEWDVPARENVAVDVDENVAVRVQGALRRVRVV